MATEQEKPVYESPFTAEAIIRLVDDLKRTLEKHAAEHGKDGKMDFFVMYAALGQTAFEMAYSSLPRNDEDREITRKEADKIVDGLLAKLDGIRAEFKTRGTSDLVAAAQFIGILAEIYCKRRDTALTKMMSDQEQQNTQSQSAQE